MAIAVKTHDAFYNKLESGRIPISYKFAEKLRSAFGISPDWLLDGKGEMYSENVTKSDSLTLRDQFANSYLCEFISRADLYSVDENRRLRVVSQITNEAYKIADLMMISRKVATKS
jgi:transcriptional regulator with XRE-family HTH domain